jgi:hypothetical protein
MSLARVEHDERPGGSDRSRLAAGDLDFALDDRHPCAFAYPMIAERLSGQKAKRDRPRITRVKNRWRPDPVGRFDLE